jgi:HD superfamily phosphohydrolase
MDYLTRDSFFSGVVEGMIGCDRILKMLTVHQGELMVEEKGIYTIEEFLVSRRLMYWQVYQHKTVLSAEMTLVRILERAAWLYKRNLLEPDFNSVLHNLLFKQVESLDKAQLEAFCTLDDTDVIHSIKQWKHHADWTLSTLCKALLNRKLLKLRLQHEPISETELQQKREQVAASQNITQEDAEFLVFTGEAENSLYDPNNERINILFKDGRVCDIAQVDSPLIHQNLSRPVKKFYICFYQP